MGLIITDTREGSHSHPDTAGLGELLPESWWAAVTVPFSLDMSLLSVLSRDPLQQRGGQGRGKVIRIFSSLHALVSSELFRLQGEEIWARGPRSGPGVSRLRQGYAPGASSPTSALPTTHTFMSLSPLATLLSPHRLLWDLDGQRTA